LADPIQALDDITTAAYASVLGLPRAAASSHIDGADKLGAAARIASVISEKVGFPISATLVEQYPGPAALALQLYLRLPPAGDCLVPSRAADDPGPILYYLHSTSGAALAARSLDRRLPLHVVGVRAAGMYGERAVPGSIEELADVYTKQIVRFQPAGPYHLIGFSTGGLLAFEVATRLPAGLVILVDTEPPGRYTGRPPTSSQELLRLRRAEVESQFGADTSDDFLATQLEIHSRIAVAARRYRAPFYPGRIHVITAEVTREVVSGWSAQAAEVTVHDVGGRHVEHEFMVDGRVLAILRRLLIRGEPR
jgi:thioesterase domain-containing protein